MRQRLAPERVFLQNDGAVAHIRKIVLVDIDRKFVHRSLGARHMRLDVDRVHVLVFVERERKAPDGFRRIEERVKSSRYVSSLNINPMSVSVSERCAARLKPRHRSRTAVAPAPSRRETQIMIFFADALVARRRGSGRCEPEIRCTRARRSRTVRRLRHGTDKEDRDRHLRGLRADSRVARTETVLFDFASCTVNGLPTAAALKSARSVRSRQANRPSAQTAAPSRSCP